MNCDEVNELMSPMLDEELPRDRADAIKEHLSGCAVCRIEYERFNLLTDRLEEFSAITQVKAPPRLWAAIEKRLDEQESTTRAIGLFKLVRRHMAMAASIALIAGLGILFAILIDRGVGTAQATTIDYNILMEGVAGDVNGAIQRFLRHYKAQPITVAQTHEVASDLSFDLPPELPGGYRFVKAYRLTLGKAPGIAATYDRAGEPLFLVFHAMLKRADHSGHTTCKIGTLQADQIEVGPWRLVHVMDDTTCHCVLSTLDSNSGLEPVVKAVAPALSTGAGHHGH